MARIILSLLFKITTIFTTLFLFLLYNTIIIFNIVQPTLNLDPFFDNYFIIVLYNDKYLSNITYLISSSLCSARRKSMNSLSKIAQRNELDEMNRILDKQEYPSEIEKYLREIANGSKKYGLWLTVIRAYCLGVIAGKNKERKRKQKLTTI